jgi:hypothetical protein
VTGKKDMGFGPEHGVLNSSSGKTCVLQTKQMEQSSLPLLLKD